MEKAGRDLGSVSRGQNVVYVMPHDWASISQFLSPLIDRVDDTRDELQLLVITPDSEVAAAVAAAAVRLAADREVQILAATSAARASRLARLRPVHILSGPETVLLEMVASTAIKLETVRMVCIAWVDELISRGGSAALETLMAELPKDAARAIVTSTATPEVEALIERYARRARRVVAHTPDLREPTAISYVAVSTQSRLRTLRRVLDHANPGSALVFVRDSEREPAVRALLQSLGYTEADDVGVGRTAAPNTELVVLFDLPATHEELREAAGTARLTVALVQPRQLTSLRALAAGGTVAPYTLPETASLARAGEARVRQELRDVLAQSNVERELLALEPLLDDYEGVEIAAAALRLLEQERESSRAREQAAVAGAAAVRTPDAPASISRTRDTGAMTRLYVNVGSRDNARANDLMGAIANQAGVTRGEIGKIDVRESHATVEVASAVAEKVLERVTGTTIRGRRVVIRRDDERPPRGAGRGPRGPARGARREARE